MQSKLKAPPASCGESKYVFGLIEMETHEIR